MALPLGATWTQDPGRGLFLLSRVKVLATANDTFTLDAPAKHGSAAVLGRGASTPPAFATATLSFSDNPADGDTVTIGGVVYSFETGAIDAAFKVDVGGDQDASLANLVAAINLTGTAGTTYGMGTTENPVVRATADADNNNLIATAKTPGSAGNSIVLAESSTALAWDGSATALSGGAGPSVLLEPDANGDLVTVVVDGAAIGDVLEIITVHDGMSVINTTETR